MTDEQRCLVEASQQGTYVNVSALARRLGLRVLEDSDLAPAISGILAKDFDRESNSGYEITVNRSDSQTRRRFTVAHLCGHYLLHRESIGDRICTDTMYRSFTMSASLDAEATRFAAALLMPRHLVNPRVALGQSPEEIAAALQVSTETMKVRLGHLSGPHADDFISFHPAAVARVPKAGGASSKDRPKHSAQRGELDCHAFMQSDNDLRVARSVLAEVEQLRATEQQGGSSTDQAPVRAFVSCARSWASRLPLRRWRQQPS